LADSIHPHPFRQSASDSLNTQRADRPRSLVIGGEAGGCLIARALAEEFDVIAAPDGSAAAGGGLPADIDLVVIAERASGIAAAVERIRANGELAELPILVVSGPDEDAPGAEGIQDRVSPSLAPGELRARARNLAAIKRARDLLRAAVPSPQGDLESLARALAAEKRSAEDARRRAETSNRAKDEFLAILAHELRTPLNAVLGWAGLLRRDGVTEDDLRRGLEVIERNARAQARLIEDVLDVSAFILRKVQVRRDPIALGSVLAEALDAVRPTAETKGITLVCDGVAGEPKVLGDAERLVQVVHNLVGNAVKFTPEGGRVTVRTRLDGGAVVLEVEDTGVGIAPDLLPHVFDQFTQGARGAKSARGLGLGLAIVRHLAELHGGTVEAASPGEGRGTTFTVRLPLLESCQPAPVEHAR
jgi:signal transduction histidine kinase